MLTGGGCGDSGGVGMHEEGFKNTAEFHSYLIAKDKRLRAYLNSLPMSLIDMVRSGELRPPEKINTCQFCLRLKNKQED